jgi:replicative DNA helicase
VNAEPHSNGAGQRRRAPHGSGPTRLLPHNLDLEASILGGVILRNEVVVQLDDLELDDFYDHRHVVVWEAIRNLRLAGCPIDVVTLEAEIERGGKLGAIGGIAFLGELALRVPTPDNVRAYADDVRLMSLQRKAILELSSALERAYTWPHDPSELIGETAARLQRLDQIGEASRRRVGRTWDDCVDEIYARKDEPWTEIRVGNTPIATCRNGSFVPLVAPSGAGKSSLALQIIVEHALHRGPAVYVTPELDGDEAAGRSVGQLCSFSWAAVLRGEVPRDLIPAVPRLRLLEIGDANVEKLHRVVGELRDRYPGQPILVVWDYLQASPAPPGKERGFVANMSSELRRAAKAERVVLVAVSQTSTENSKKMRAGELLGLDAAATGAETSQIERDAYVILTLGDRQPIDHETVSWKLSTAKYRLGVPDVVHELHYRGRVGTWEVVGEAKSASEVRANRDVDKKAKRIAELKRSIVALVQASTRPLSKQNIIDASTGNDRLILNTVKELIGAGDLALMPGARRGGSALVWTPDKAREEQS